MAEYPSIAQLFKARSSSASPADIVATLVTALTVQSLADALLPLQKASGIVTLVSAQTAIVVTHGLASTPTADQIQVTPIESLGTASYFWFDTITATTFTININAVAGADVDFVWRADKV